MSYICTVCDKDVKGPKKLTEESVPIFVIIKSGAYERAEGWISRILSCSSCLNNLGRPIMIMHRPYEGDIAKFEKAEKIVLKGSGPRDD